MSISLFVRYTLMVLSCFIFACSISTFVLFQKQKKIDKQEYFQRTITKFFVKKKWLYLRFWIPEKVLLFAMAVIDSPYKIRRNASSHRITFLLQLCYCFCFTFKITYTFLTFLIVFVVWFRNDLVTFLKGQKTAVPSFFNQVVCPKQISIK